MIILSILALVAVSAPAPPFVVPQSTVAQSAVPPSVQDVRALITAYERRAPEPPDTKQLEAIAQTAFGTTLRSRVFDVWREACTEAPEDARTDCTRRLRGVLDNPKAPVDQRAAAGAALLKLGEKGAADPLYEVVKDLEPAVLTTVAPSLSGLPEDRAVSLLRKLIDTGQPAAQMAACRVLGAMDTGQARTALATAVAAAPPGTQAWLSCSVAQARLSEPTMSPSKLYAMSAHMSSQELLDAADALVALGDARAEEVLKKLTREARPPVQLAAAERLAAIDPDYARQLATAKLSDAEPRIRAQALVVIRRLGGAPSAEVRKMMGDADEMVRLRASQAVREWARAQK